MQEFILPHRTILANNEFIRLAQYSWNDVMAEMAQSNDMITVGEHNVRTYRLKYQTFVRDYYEGKFCCSSCGIEPSHAVIFSTPQSSEKFINFFALDNDKEVLLTHDHTIARSLGGTNELDNTTTMCEQCNRRKSVFESIYGNHRLDIIKNYLNNSLGQSVSLSKLDTLAKNFDISGLDPKFLSGAMYLLFVFNNEATFDKAIGLLAKRIGVSHDEYLNYCNSMGEHLKNFPPTVFPFARILYPKLTAFGAQFLRLDISKHLKITWPNTLALHEPDPVYFDDIFQSIMVNDHPVLGKVFCAQDLQKTLKKHPKLWDCSTLYFGTTPVDFSPQARAFLQSPISDPDLMIAVRKNIRRALVPGRVIDNTFVASQWDIVQDTTVQISSALARKEPRLEHFNGLTPALIKQHPVYVEMLIELMCFQQNKSVDHLIRHSKAKIDPNMLIVIKQHQPELNGKAAEALASCSWSVDEFLINWQRKIDAEAKSQQQKIKKHNTTKLKRHFGRNDDERSHSKRAFHY